MSDFLASDFALPSHLVGPYKIVFFFHDLKIQKGEKKYESMNENDIFADKNSFFYDFLNSSIIIFILMLVTSASPYKGLEALQDHTFPVS